MVDPADPEDDDDKKKKKQALMCEGATAGTSTSSQNGMDANVETMEDRQSEQSPLLHLDLSNFDSPEAEGSRYVLTSPRSLEACVRCGVRPVELLPRSINDFVKQAPGKSMRVATGLFEVYEAERQRKLQECRDERGKIIKEEKRRIFTHFMSSVPSSPAAKVETKTNGKVTAPPAVRPKSHSWDSLQRKKDASGTRSSSESGTSSFSSDSLRDKDREKWVKAGAKTKALFTVNSFAGRSLSLSDLSHSPQTTQKVEKIVKEVKKKCMKEVPERDKKIAALMLAKHQEENILSEQRYVAHMQWDIEKKLEETRREREEKEKQKALQQCQKMWESKVGRRHQKQYKEETESVSKKQKQFVEHEDKWHKQADRQEKMKKEKIKQTKEEEQLKKLQQEHSLKAKEESKKLLDQSIQTVQEKLSVAEQKRLDRELQLHEAKKAVNRAEKLKHEMLLKEITKEATVEKQMLRKTLEENLQKAQENYNQLLEKRNRELRERAKKEELQLQKARMEAEKREKEHREHLEALAKAAERKLQHAQLVAEEMLQQKARKAVQSRMEKEKVQKLNRQKVQQEEDVRRKELLMSIEKKLEKSEQIFREKKAVLEGARSVARASFHVREKVRVETNVRTFDKMALEAELHANMDKA
ncbi:coiled-coil domain-containing protein 177 [Protopterus annectens]|uniref:coiled-coil domain-containing protein 177 n=1 Tax=Protopterus annectens TaxID=7888 RepID=UPI001CFAD5B0|nr:coiled-coil domain-containing protein 177 [Protopterus annectens]